MAKNGQKWPKMAKNGQKWPKEHFSKKTRQPIGLVAQLFVAPKNNV
jgi:hypothetical protein